MTAQLYFNDVESDFEYSVVLDGEEYILRFVWNSVSETWQLTIKNYEGNILISGVRVVTGLPLVTIYKSLNIPLGVLIVVQNKTGPLLTPSRYSFKEGVHSLIYLTEAEIDEINSQI